MASATPDLTQEPFAELMRAHREIEAHVAELERAVAEAVDGPRREAARATIAAVIDYFAGPAAVHHADEEESLFPHLRPLEEFARMLPAFEFQHQLNDQTYDELRAAFAAGGEAQLGPLVYRFAEMQRAHIMAEERALFPLAATSLSPEILGQIAGEMASRRG